MAPRQSVKITGSVLEWALREDALSEADLASQLGVEVDEVLAWERGDAFPSKGQFSALTELLRRPRALFYLPSPPSPAEAGARLRAGPGLLGHDLTTKERRAIRRGRRLQEAIGWLMRRRGSAPIEFPTYATDRWRPEDVALSFRDWLDIPLEEQVRWRDQWFAWHAWREIIEERKVLVFQFELGSGGVRGFSLWDDVAPLVVVNTAYNVSARAFTLFHEIGHLVTRTDSACSAFVAPGSDESSARRLELWCEQFASASLLPPREFKSLVQNWGYSQRNPVTEFEDVRRIANRFKVSIRAAAIALIRNELAHPDVYSIVEERAQLVDRPAEGGGGGSGLARPERRLSQLGEQVPDLFLTAAQEGLISTRDATDYLGVSTGELDDLDRLVHRGSE